MPKDLGIDPLQELLKIFSPDVRIWPLATSLLIKLFCQQPFPPLARPALSLVELYRPLIEP
jgi:hypothetical protein